jgi:cytochrome c
MSSRHTLLLLALVGAAAHAAGDAKRGAQLFRQCMACHSVAEGEHLTGPSLAHAWGHKAGTGTGFQRYSDAMKRADVVWDDATLDKWLANPQALVPGTSMTFPGLKDAKDRLDIAAYLRAIADNKAPPAEMKGGMGMTRGKPDLNNAPPKAQVKSIRYCGDAYSVETADGRTEKVWEFNLRFKTDSSKLGPAPGKPVAIGAGMQGDRSSIVFASPKEISEFVKLDCR